MITIWRYRACVLLSFFAIALLVSSPSGAAADDDGFDLTLKKVLPCQETAPDSNVSLYRSDILAVQANLTFCNSSWNVGPYNGFRLSAAADANSTYPVIFTARQSFNGTVSFSIPLQPEGFSLMFTDVSRTLCPVENPGLTPTMFYIDVFTSSPDPLNYSVRIDPVDNFTLSLNEPHQTIISPSSPQIFYFKMEEGDDVVTVDVATDSKKCVIVSVQNKTCPVNDVLENARSKGIYQTMSTSAVLTVEAHQVVDREFLLVLIATGYHVCHDKKPGDGNDTYEQQLNITIKKLKPLSSLWRAFFVPVVFFFVIPYVLTLIVLCLCFPKLRCVPTWDLKHPCKQKPFKCVGFCDIPFLQEVIRRCRRSRGDETISLIQENGPSTRSYNTIEDGKSQAAPALQKSSAAEQMNGNSSSNGFLDSDSIEISIKYETDEGKMMVPRISKKSYSQLHKRYAVYGWNAITVGIFYALPAFQLVLSEQRVLNFSGDQDQCYYNFKCAHPLSALSAFNNVFSNIGYVALGALFLIVVSIKHRCYLRRREADKATVDSYGLPRFFGIYYAMGIALVLEGFMSSFYHICPNDANFQFDTAFMFIIGGLLLVKVFQQRHPDIHANAFIAFFSFAVIIICTLVGIYFSRNDPIATRLPIFLLILLLLVAFLVSFYYFHDWKWGSLWRNVVKQVKSWIPSSKEFKGPIHKVRFCKLLLAFIANVILAVVALILYETLDIATAILAFFLVNLILFLVMYFLSKLWFKEPLTWLALVLPVVIGLVWGTAFYFFMGVAVTDWSVTPAESREMNKECTLLDFYDNHDVWHFLSAFGMFFAFMFVLVLDDGIEDVKRVDLHIF